MQHKGMNKNMNSECDGAAIPPQSRARNNSKLKVLVRSHAMREETSPPREPTPTRQHSPFIKVIPSPNRQSPINPYLLVSPSISRSNSPAHSSPVCLSPSNTLMPTTPTSPKHSPRSLSPHSATIIEISPRSAAESRHTAESPHHHYHQTEFIDASVDSPKYLNNNNRVSLGTEVVREGDMRIIKNSDVLIEEETSQHQQQREISKNDVLTTCTCSPNCHKCIRNYNNNLNGNINNNNNVVSSTVTPNMLSVNRANIIRGKLRQQSSSQGSFEGSSCNSPCLSRDSSSEQYTDTTGVNLELFIPETLNKNAKDRALMLRIEQELVNLAKDNNKTFFKFPPMSSYQRMLVHRCAAYFGMAHNIEPSGKCVLVNKTENTRIPDVEFKQHIKEDLIFSEEPRRSILKRDSNSMEDYSFKSPDRQYSLENRRSKSIEEREEEYQRARRRIFNKEMRECDSTDDFCWAEAPWSSTESEPTTRFRLQLPDHLGRSVGGRLLKVHSEETHDETMRPCVLKSYSFGGYGGGHTRGENVITPGTRCLTKQDSAASSVSWRLSPSSSGYKTQSQRSESVTPSPTSTPHLSRDSMRQDSTNSVATNTSEQPSPNSDVDSDRPHNNNDQRIVWIEADIHQAPKGCVIIDPQTAQPVKNHDGTIYHYDPSNPPPNFGPSINTKPPPSPTKACIISKREPQRAPSPKKRTRSSPVKKSLLTNSSTSPSLPFTPPPITTPRPVRFQNAHSTENMAPKLIQQTNYPIYGQNFGPPSQQPSSEGAMQFYQQPYYVYAAPYPVQYDGRIDGQIQEVPYYLPDCSGNPTAAAYQTPPPPSLWNQPSLPFYPSAQAPNVAPRFSLPVHGQTAPFVQQTYPSSYVPHAQNPPNTDVVPMFHHHQQQPVQIVYPSQPNQPNPVVYPSPSQSVMYSQNPIYGNPPLYQATPNTTHVTYPQCTTTPNNCQPPVPPSAFCGQISAENTSIPPHRPQSGYMTQLAQTVSQMSITSGTNGQQSFGQKSMIGYESRTKSVTPKGTKFSNPKGLGMSSSQSSTEASSPAVTVIAGYCPNQSGGLYRTPPETPPTHAFSNNFVQPVLLRQMNNVRSSPPVTNRSSRSPTPAGDISLMERQRFSLQPALYQGISYVLQDSRLIPGRGQQNMYRQQSTNRSTNFGQTTDSKTHKNRKTRGNKLSSLPPNGK